MVQVLKQTIEFGPLGIRNGVDGDLDKLKRTYNNMSHMLPLIAKEQEWPFEFRIVFMAQIGYLVKIDF